MLRTNDRSSESDGDDARAAIGRGARGGFVATVVMTLYRMPVARSSPPPARFWRQYVGVGGERTTAAAGLVLHLVYGTVGGVIYGLVNPVDVRHSAAREAVELLVGLLYGLALSVVGTRVVLGRVLGLDLDADEALVFHVSHAIYGLTLGTWYGSRSGED